MRRRLEFDRRDLLRDTETQRSTRIKTAAEINDAFRELEAGIDTRIVIEF